MSTIAKGVQLVRGKYQIQWCAAGRRFRELLPRGTTEKRAIRERERRLVAAEEGRLPVAAGRVTYETLMEQRRLKLEADHKEVRDHVHLDDAFRGRRAADITYSAIQRYVTERQAAGAADATIGNELAALRRAFRLGRKAGLVTTVPDFPMPTVQNVRESYFTVAELGKLYAALPPHLRTAAEFGARTGWRAGNVFDLQWEHVDFAVGTVRCPFGRTKSGEPLVTPFAVGSALARLLRERERSAAGPYVFHRGDGARIRSYAGAWGTAVKSLGAAAYGTQYDPRTGGTRRVLKRWHDLRHSFAQLATEAGVAEADLLALGGWKTRAMLDRYRISSQEAKKKAIAKLDAHVATEERTAARVITLNLKRRAG